MKRRFSKLASISVLTLLLVGLGFGVYSGLSGSQSVATFSRISSGLSGGSGAYPTSAAGSDKLVSGVLESSADYDRYEREMNAFAPTGGEDAYRPGNPNIIQQSPLTAGQVDDNAKYQEYLDYLSKYYGSTSPIDVTGRLFLRVVDGDQSPVAGAQVQLFDGGKEVFRGQTVSDGRTLFLPKMAGIEQSKSLRAVITRGQTSVEADVQIGADEQVVTLTGLSDNTGAVGLDLVFLLDATGSMSDEIERIKETVSSIASRIEQVPGSSAPRFALVAYRDDGDLYVTRQWDFTSDINQFSANLANVEAGGGGDTPEAVDAGLREAINLQGWADNSSGRQLRMIVLVGDAPPHATSNNEYTYADLLGQAVEKGIKIFPVGASNLDTAGEYVFRQFAQVTQGQFVFLTYANGVSGAPGTLTDKHVEDYSVKNLDNLIVGLVEGEIRNQTGQAPSGVSGKAIPSMAIAPVVEKSGIMAVLGSLFDGNGPVYVAALVSVVLLVVYGTGREKARVSPVPAASQSVEIYVPESQAYAAAELRQGPVTAPLGYFRMAESSEDRDLAAAHLQPGASTISLEVDVQPANKGNTIPL